MKKIYLLIALLLFAFNGFSQTFFRNYPDSINHAPIYIFEPGHGGLIDNPSYTSLGSTITPHDHLFRIKDNGDTSWNKYNLFSDTIYRVFYDTSLPTYPYYDTAYFVGLTQTMCRLHNGNYILAAVDVSGFNDVLIKQLDSFGNVISTLPIYEDSAMGALNVGGYMNLTSIPNTDSFYFIYSEDRSLPVSIPGIPDSLFNRVRITKFDNHLNALWTKDFSKMHASIYPYTYTYCPLLDFQTITATTEGGLAFCVSYDTCVSIMVSAIDTQVLGKYFIHKLKPDGSLQWERRLQSVFTTPDSIYIFSRHLFNTSDSAIVASINLITQSNNDATGYLAKFIANGILVDTMHFDSSVHVPSVGAELSTGKYLFATWPWYNFTVYDNHLNILYPVPWPFGENAGIGNNFIPNNVGGAFIACDLDLSQTDVAVNFDSTFHCYPSYVTGYVTKDNNYDCAYGAGDERRAGSVRLHEAATGIDYYGFGNSLTGQYTANVPYGNYSVSHSTYGYVANECGGYALNITSPVTLAGNDFYDTVISGIKDFRVSLYGYLMRPGIATNLYADLHNNGTVDMDSTLSITLDSRVSYISATPAPDAVYGNVLTYHMHLAPDSFAQITININPATSLMYTDTLLFLASAPYANTIDPSADSVYLRTPVLSAFDPNVKIINQEFYFDKGNDLIYTVCFQNTGNDTARSVAVLDAMDSHIDPSTLQVLSSNHAMPLVTWLPDNKFVFTFKNIYLPDSLHNEPASHGCFSYMVRAKQTAVSGDTIRNTADIYFDYNPAVVTNTTTNVVGTRFPTGIATTNTATNVQLYPNPTTGKATLVLPAGGNTYTVHISDITGRTISVADYTEKTIPIDIAGNSAGIYLLRITNKQTHETFIKKLLLNK